MRRTAIVSLSVFLILSLVLGAFLVFAEPPSAGSDKELRAYDPPTSPPPSDVTTPSPATPAFTAEEDDSDVVIVSDSSDVVKDTTDGVNDADGSDETVADSEGAEAAEAADDANDTTKDTSDTVFMPIEIPSDNEPFPAAQEANMPEPTKNAVSETVHMSSLSGAATAGGEFRGVWVPSVYNLDYPSKSGLSVENLKAEAIQILDKSKDIGFNAVFLQVRPTGDALYKSEIFPWSDYLTGQQGKAPADGFDPLAFWVSEAHKRGMELHAWINPFRITRGSVKNPKQNLQNLTASNPARKNPAWTVKYTDGSLYYNPGVPEVRRLIVNGVAEIVRNYSVDGIHFDDYFYPGKDFSDDATYKTHGKGFKNKADWRRDCVNQLIRDTNITVKEINSACLFGVSPVGIWANKSSNTYGSDTKGQESYYEHYADARKWVKSEWVDYICPQIYWNIGYAIADYQKLANWWADVVKDTSVKLYVGQAAYRVNSSTKAGDAWNGTGELLRQFQLNESIPAIKGTVQYRYGSFTADKALYDTVKNAFNPDDGTAVEVDAPPDTGTGSRPQMEQVVMPASNMGSLSVGRPASDCNYSGKNYYLLGVSDPNQPLYLNGEVVENRSAGGSFGIYVKINNGANVFTFSQGDTKVTRKITKKSASSPSRTKMSKAEIVADSVYPSLADEYRRAGESVTLKCTAPIGAKVTVKLGGSTYTMKPESTSAPAGVYYATTYTYVYSLPPQSATGKIITIGKPVYTMTFDGKSSVRTAKPIHCVTQSAPYYAEVTSDFAFVFAGASTSGGPVGELAKGQKDYVSAVTANGAWVRLASMGVWIQKGDIKRGQANGQLANKIKSANYALGDTWDTLTLAGTAPTGTRVSYNGKALTLSVYAATASPNIVLPDGAPFNAASAKLDNKKAVYTLTLADGERIDGYYVNVVDGKLTLNIKRAVRSGGGDLPLEGITILVDPGHGGSDIGALGPFGKVLPEKIINLYTATKVVKELQALGADVYMTRTEDVAVSLEKRLEMNRSLRPDLFLSVHGNSLDDGVDASSVQGVSTWYREATSASFAKTLYDFVRNDLPRPYRGNHQANLYVARPTWTPSVIIETGFLCNPNEAEWMADNPSQNALAASIAQGVVAYFNS